MASKTLLPTVRQSKRTRIGVKQSKYGCFTCKARHIKCDEEKPSCLRCSRSKKICRGYPAQATSNESFSPQSSPPELGLYLSSSRTSSTPLNYPLYNGFRRTIEQDRLSRLGCNILAHDRYDEDWGDKGRYLWNGLLFQLGHAIPSINSAAAALGAVYESRFLTSSDHKSGVVAESQYNIALRIIQQDIARQPHGLIPLIIACILLTFAELLQRHQFNALAHLDGAFKILSICDDSASEFALPGVSLQSGRHSKPTNHSASEDNFCLDLMFRALDIQTSSYVLGRPPKLLPSPLAFIQMHPSQFRNVRHARECLVEIIHSCYHFTAKASEYKYLPRDSIPSELLVEQGRHIGHLTSWLRTLDHEGPPRHRHARMLRAQCLVTIIYASTVMSPFENVYDSYASSFQKIIKSSIAALDTEELIDGPIQHFAGAELGTMHPLFFTAIKYRHSSWRRKAIDMLREGGREGPWDGKILAAVATRAMEIEEAGLVLDGSEIAPEHIADHLRLHGCALDAEARDDKPVNTVGIRFSRCYDIGEMLSSTVPWENMSNWCIWEEDLTF